MDCPRTEAAFAAFKQQPELAGVDTDLVMRAFCAQHGETVADADLQQGRKLRPYWERIEARLASTVVSA